MSDLTIDTNSDEYKRDCESLDEIIAVIPASVEVCERLDEANQKKMFDADERLRKCIRLAQLLNPILTRFQNEVFE